MRTMESYELTCDNKSRGMVLGAIATKDTAPIEFLPAPDKIVKKFTDECPYSLTCRKLESIGSDACRACIDNLRYFVQPGEQYRQN